MWFIDERQRRSVVHFFPLVVVRYRFRSASQRAVTAFNANAFRCALDSFRIRAVPPLMLKSLWLISMSRDFTTSR
jgi:hypothetical protein